MSDALAALVERRVTAWAGRLELLPDGALNPRSRIAQLPRLVAELYPPVDEGRLVEATFALCAFSDAIVSCDDVIDYAATDPTAARRLPAVAVMFAEAYRGFAGLFGGNPPFWDAVRAYFADYVDALAAEARIAHDDQAWTACTVDDALAIVRGKNGLVRLVDAALAALAGCEQRGGDRVLLEWFAAEQMLDDLNDWREDVRDRNVSVLLRGAWPTRPDPADLETVGLRLYREGHVEQVLALAERLARDAAALAREREGAALVALIDGRADAIAQRRAQVREVVAAC